MMDLARNLLDLPIVFHFLGSEKVGPKMAGFCGTITSLISLYNLWVQ